MCHVGLDEMAGGQGTAETELAGENCSGDDAGETARVVAGCGWVGAFDAEEVEHG